MGENIVKLDDFEGEIAEHWQDARGRKVIDKNGDEVGTVGELYVWEAPSTVHLIKVSGEEGSFLIPVHAVTNADEDAVRSEEHTSELQSRQYLVCRLLLEKKKNYMKIFVTNIIYKVID